MTDSNNTSNWQPTGEYRLDWDLTGADGSASLVSSQGNPDVMVSVSTPQNGAGEQFTLDNGKLESADNVKTSNETIIEFGKPVTDLNFQIEDVDSALDTYKGKHDFDDKVTVLAYGPNGELLDVDFSDLHSSHEVNGNSVEGNAHLDEYGETSLDNVTVKVAGPVSKIVIVHENGGEDDESGVVRLTDMGFNCPPDNGGDSDGIVSNDDDGDLIDESYDGDPDGDFIDNDDAKLPGETGDDDIVYAMGGDDTILAGDGDDEVYAGDGDDYVEGGNGDDLIRGDSETREGDVNGGDCDVTSNAGDDELYGGAGNDTIYGEGGDDYIEGNGGDDVLYGDHGTDGTTGPQTVTIDFNDLSAGDIVSGQYDGVTISSASGANPAMIFDTDNPTGGDDDLATDNLGNVLILSEDGDSNDPDDNQGGGTFIFDFEGDVRVDSLTFLDNDEGPATLRFYDADGNLTGTQTVDPTAAEGQKVASINVDGVSKMTVTLVGSAAIDNLVYTTEGGDCDPGTAGNDTILGGDGNDLIYGEDGNDTLTGGAGEDESYGGEGDDTFIVDNAEDAANDIVVGGNGPDETTDYDVLDLRGAGQVTINATEDESDEGALKGTVVFENGETLSFSQIEEILTDGQNEDPDAVDDTATTTEDESVTISLLDNDSDPDGDTLTIISGTNPSNGTLTDNGNGNVTYTPDAGFTGTDTFTYTISDGNGGTDTATVTVNVQDGGGENTVDAVDDSYTIDEDTTLIVDLTANDSDPEGDDFQITSVGAAANGTATLNGDGTVTYKPNDDFNGTDTFTYTITDDQGATDTATVTINVGPVDDDPDAENDVTLTDEGVAVDIDVLANDSDPDGDTLTVIDYAQPTNGAVTDGPGGTLTYTPADDFTGTDTFTYTISDGNGGTDTATVTVVVGDVDDNTVDAVDDTATTTAGNAVPITVLANDTDPEGDSFSVTGFTNGANGSVTADANGVLTYTPDAGFTGQDTFTYTITDDEGATDTATVTVTVNDGGQNSVDAVDDSYDIDEDSTLIVDLTANDSDPQGDDFSVTSVGTPTNGTATLNPDGTVTYKPNADYTGTDSFTYTITDDQGATDTATVTVSMAPVNDDPDAEDDVRVTDDTDPLVIDVLANDTDVDGDTLTVTDVTTPSFGTVTDNGDGTVTYDPMDDFTGTDTFDYTISDGNGGTDTATVTVVVNGDGGMNSVVARDDSADTMGDNVVDIDVLANDSDPQGDTFSVQSYGQPTNGTVTDGPGGTLTYTADAGFTGIDSFTYTIVDDQGATDTATVTVNVTQQGVNTVDAVDDTAQTDANTAVNVAVLANDTDPEGDGFTVTAFGQGANGTVSTGPGGTLTYTPDTDFTGTDTFTYTITDDQGATDTANVTVSVGMGPMNTVDAVDDSYDIDEDTTLIVDLTANDSDPEGDDFDVTSVGTPTNGTATLNPDGTVTYRPMKDFTGSDTFTYTVTDENGATDTATVTINLAPVNDDPDAEDDVRVIDEDTSINIDVLANDEDADNDPLVVTSYDQPTNGTVTDGPGGTLTYTPNTDFTGTDTFDYTISDGNGGTDTATVTVVVQPDGGNQNTTDAVDDAYATDVNTPYIGNVLDNDTDPEGDGQTVTDNTDPSFGTVTVNADGSFTYAPDTDYTGTDTFTYTITDDQGATDTATVTLSIGVDAPPLANDDTANVPINDTVTIDVLANDTDPDGDDAALTVIAATASEGSVVINADGTLTYTPTVDGYVTVDYTIQDEDGLTDTATVTILVNDGIVEGTTGDDLIDTGYTGDPEGDMVDADDNIFPGKGPDDDIIEAYEGDDIIYAGDGDDEVYGGDGSDTVYGEDGDDYIDTSAPTEASDYGFAPGETVDGWPFNPITPAQLVPDDLDEDNDKDTVYGGAGNDTIITGDDDDYIEGGEGNDTIDGGLDDDEIYGNEGDDFIIGGHGSDTIEGGDGDDEIWGGLGPNTPDILDLEDEDYGVDDYGDADTNDPQSVGPIFNDPRPANGIDIIRGGDGNDIIYGQDDDDVLYGDAGDDFIDGGIDDDTIYGGEGNDELYGGKGQDLIDGGAGVDEAYGGDDRDTFINVNVGDFVDGGEGGDDWDTLDLTGTKPAGGSIQITKGLGGNPENGFVEFFDSNGQSTGTMNFVNIEDIVPCFTPGTLIATPKGEVPVEELGEGDRIITRDNGIQEIRWIGHKTMGWQELNRSQHLKPVLIKAGSLGNGLPERDMLVSPNHRMLVANDRTALYFDEREVLASAKHLVSKGIQVVDVKEVTYIHFLFDHHEVVLSDGTWSESFQPGDYSLKGIGNAQRQELFELFPELETRQGIEDFTSARRILKKHEAKMLRK